MPRQRKAHVFCPSCRYYGALKPEAAGLAVFKEGNNRGACRAPSGGTRGTGLPIYRKLVGATSRMCWSYSHR